MCETRSTVAGPSDLENLHSASIHRPYRVRWRPRSRFALLFRYVFGKLQGTTFPAWPPLCLVARSTDAIAARSQRQPARQQGHTMYHAEMANRREFCPISARVYFCCRIAYCDSTCGLSKDELAHPRTGLVASPEPCVLGKALPNTMTESYTVPRGFTIAGGT